MNQEESKAEEPKSEEPVVEEPVAEEPKAEEPKAEEPKSEEPVVEESKAEEPVVEESKAEEAVDYLSTRNVNNKIETFSSGDTVVLNLLIKEGERERVQAFQGNIIRGNHINGKKVLPGKSFTVRRMASGVGVERTLPLSSPSIDSLKVIRKGKVRQSKLYYLRDLTGKKARIKEAR